jgi:hypothetical protein
LAKAGWPNGGCSSYWNWLAKAGWPNGGCSSYLK